MGEDIEAMSPQMKRDGAKIFATVFAESLAGTFSEAAGSSCPLEVVDLGGVSASNDNPIHFRVTLEDAISGECFVELYEQQAKNFLAKVLGEPVDEITDKHLEVLAKPVISAMSKTSEALCEKFGQFNFKLDRVSGLAFGGMFMIPIASRKPGMDLQVSLYFGGPMLDSLAAACDDGQTKPGDRTDRSACNLKMVMDVELNVSLRFGQRQLPLRDILELSSGSVVELDRMVDEPVELFLDGKLIARGEAVVVDGNYGLRVTEIPQPMSSYFLN
jgi:flagellar motor switch protein FliN/FliY